MVSIGTRLHVSDNSGALKVKCLRIVGSSSRSGSYIGDTLVVSIQSVRKLRSVYRHEVHKGILIRQKLKTFRTNGMFFSFLKNTVVLIKKKNNDPIGNRILGSVLQELRYKKCIKIMILAERII